MLGEPEYTTFRTDSGGQRVSIELVENPEELTSTLKKNVPLPAGLLAGQSVTAEKLTAEQIEKRGEHFILKEDPAIRIDARSFKMSKSRGNVVSPDDIISDYGADSLRMFEMFMGPIEAGKPWSTAGVEGLYRFLQRIWRNLFDENDNPKVADIAEPGELQRPLHRLIKKVTDDIERLGFNTAIAAMMEFNNLLAKSTAVPRDTALTFMRLLAPFAPHFAEEVHAQLAPGGNPRPAVASITTLPWPTYNPAYLVDATIEVPVQINGKLRARIILPNDADETAAISACAGGCRGAKASGGQRAEKEDLCEGPDGEFGCISEVSPQSEAFKTKEIA